VRSCSFRALPRAVQTQLRIPQRAASEGLRPAPRSGACHDTHRLRPGRGGWGGNWRRRRRRRGPRLDDASSAAPAGLRATASAGAGLRAASSELRAASGLRVAGWLRPRIGESRPQSPRPRDGGSHCSEVTVPSFAGWRSIDANFADAPRRRPPESNDPLRLMSCCAVQASRWAVHWPRREPSTPPARSAPPEPGQRKAGRQVAGSRHH
jgi:hypothetical protein